MRVHVLGDAFCDVVALGVDAVPQFGGGSMAERIRQFAGGSALNCAVHLQSLLSGMGAEDADHQVVLFTALGGEDDWASRVLLGHLKANEVEVTAAKIHGYPTGVCIVLSGQGDRAFITSAGAVQFFSPQHVDLDELASCDHLHFSGLYSLTAFVNHLPRVLETIREINPSITISLDTNHDSTDIWGFPWLGDSLPFVDVVKMNELEAAEVHRRHEPEQTMSALTWLASKVRFGAVITLGAEGAIYALANDPNTVLSVPTAKVNVIDACGAGDAWNAGFISGWKGRGYDFADAVSFGCLSGALSVTEAGACEVPLSTEMVDRLSQRVQSNNTLQSKRQKIA